MSVRGGGFQGEGVVPGQGEGNDVFMHGQSVCSGPSCLSVVGSCQRSHCNTESVSVSIEEQTLAQLS